MEALNPQKIASKRGTGFTLVELCISLALIALVASLAIPTFFARTEVTLENAAELLASDLRSAQNRAAFLNREVHLHLLDEGAGYWIDDAINEKSAVLYATTKRDYSENAVFEGVTVEEIELEQGALLKYGPRGIASTSARITLGFRGEERVVTVRSVTGHLVIEGSTRGWVDSDY